MARKKKAVLGEDVTGREKERKGTTYSDDGLSVFVQLRVSRRDYEFCRHWAHFHAKADPAGTAEDQLEGYLNMALMGAIEESDWSAPAEIEALYPEAKKAPDDMGDGIPF